MNLDGQTLMYLLTLLLEVTLILLAVLLVLTLAAYVWSRLTMPVQRWREQANNQMRDIDASLKTMKQEIAAIQQAAKLYSPKDLDPYKATATELHLILAEIEGAYDDQAGQFDNLSKKVFKSPDNFLARILFSLGPGPDYWQQRSQHVEDLFSATQGLREMVNEARSLLEKLADQPLEVARRARKLHRQIEECLQIAADLRSSGVHGDKLDRDEPEVKDLKTKLHKIPAYFFENSDELVKQQSGKEDVIAAWPILNDIEKPSEQYLKEFRRWQAEYRKIGQRLARVRTEINTIETRLAEMFFSIGPLDEVKKLKAIIQELNQRYQHLSIEHFADFDMYLTEVIYEVDSLDEGEKEIEKKLEEAQKKEHKADEELETLGEMHSSISWIKELLSQAGNEKKILREGGSVSKVLDELKKLSGIYDQMMRRAEQQIWRHMKSSTAA
jgi:hypothetical protein